MGATQLEQWNSSIYSLKARRRDRSYDQTPPQLSLKEVVFRDATVQFLQALADYIEATAGNRKMPKNKDHSEGASQVKD